MLSLLRRQPSDIHGKAMSYFVYSVTCIIVLLLQD